MKLIVPTGNTPETVKGDALLRALQQAACDNACYTEEDKPGCEGEHCGECLFNSDIKESKEQFIEWLGGQPSLVLGNPGV